MKRRHRLHWLHTLQDAVEAEPGLPLIGATHWRLAELAELAGSIENDILRTQMLNDIDDLAREEYLFVSSLLERESQS